MYGHFLFVSFIMVLFCIFFTAVSHWLWPFPWPQKEEVWVQERTCSLCAHTGLLDCYQQRNSRVHQNKGVWKVTPAVSLSLRLSWGRKTNDQWFSKTYKALTSVWLFSMAFWNFIVAEFPTWLYCYCFLSVPTHPHYLHPFPSAPQVPGDVLQSVPGNPAACQPIHQPLLHDAGLRDARAAVIWWHRLHQEDLGPGQVGARSPRLLHEANERRSPWRLDYQDGLDLSHNPPARHELNWQLRKERRKRLVATTAH